LTGGNKGAPWWQTAKELTLGLLGSADVRNKLCLPAPSKERNPSTLPGTHCSTKGASRFDIRNKKSSGMWRFSETY